MQQAVIVSIRLSDNQFVSSAEREAIFALGDQLSAAIAAAGAGVYDGDEVGQGRGVLFMYGPDADRLFAVVEPILRCSALTFDTM